MDLRTPIARVRGLGSAKGGTDHWWMQRITAIALIPLIIWLVGSFVAIASADYVQTVRWIRSPVVSVMLCLTIHSLFYHTQLGLQVIVEDYVHVEWVKFTALITVKLIALVMTAIGVFSVLKIAFGS